MLCMISDNYKLAEYYIIFTNSIKLNDKKILNQVSSLILLVI